MTPIAGAPQQDPGAVPTTAGWTQLTPTNITVTGYDLSGDRGVGKKVVTATATSRATMEYRAGTSIAAQWDRAGLGASYPLGGGAIGLRRSSDGKMIVMWVGNVATYMGLRCFAFTDENTISTSAVDRVVNHNPSARMYYRVRVSAANTVLVESSPSGDSDWTVATGGTINVTTLIGAGDPDQVVRGIVSQSTGDTVFAQFRREIIS